MALPDWYLNEIDYAGSEHLDPGYVPTYDEKAGTDPEEDLRVLRSLGLNSTHILVDLGAGTGTFALAAAPLCKRVVAVDVSPVMLGRLKEKAAGVGAANVEAVQGGFLSYEHRGEAADFVYSRHALHHLPDFWKAIALQRIAAMLKPGGTLYLRDLIYSFDLSETGAVIGRWLANAPTNPDAGWTRAELVTHLQKEYSPYSWLLEPMLKQAGFQIKTIEHGSTRVHSAYTCIKMG